MYIYIYIGIVRETRVELAYHARTEEEKGNGVAQRRGFRFQNDWGEIGVSRYRLATLDVISFKGDTRVPTGQFRGRLSLVEERILKTRVLPDFSSSLSLSLVMIPASRETLLLSPCLSFLCLGFRSLVGCRSFVRAFMAFFDSIEFLNYVVYEEYVPVRQGRVADDQSPFLGINFRIAWTIEFLLKSLFILRKRMT